MGACQVQGKGPAIGVKKKEGVNLRDKQKSRKGEGKEEERESPGGSFASSSRG